MCQGTNEPSKVFKEYQTDVRDYMQLNQKLKGQEKHHDLQTRKANFKNDLWKKKNLFKNDLWVREKTVMKITKYLDLQM